MKQHNDSWDENVPYRIKELESRGDKTYWELLVPLFLNDVKKFASMGKVIDVGCGLGFLTGMIASCVERITGIDTSAKSIEYAKVHSAHSNAEYINTSIIDFQHQNQGGNFDICVANMVFHNISNIEENINAIARLLTQNGHLLFSIPNPHTWYKSRKYKKSPAYNYHLEGEFEVPFQIKDHEKHPRSIVYCHRPMGCYHQLLTKNNFETIIFMEPLLNSAPHNNEESDILYCACKLK